MAERKRQRGGYLPLEPDTLTLAQWKKLRDEPPVEDVHFVRVESAKGGDL